MIQEQMRRVGIDVQVRRMEFNTLVDKNLEHDFDATLGAWGIDTSLDLTYAFHTDSIDNGYNFGSYSNPEVDRLIDDFRRQTDPEVMGAILRTIEGYPPPGPALHLSLGAKAPHRCQSPTGQCPDQPAELLLPPRGMVDGPRLA